MNEYFDQDAWHRALRKNRIRSAGKVGSLAGFSESYGRQVAAGLLPSMAARDKIAKVLGVSPGELWKTVPEAAMK